MQKLIYVIDSFVFRFIIATGFSYMRWLTILSSYHFISLFVSAAVDIILIIIIIITVVVGVMILIHSFHFILFFIPTDSPTLQPDYTLENHFNAER